MSEYWQRERDEFSVWVIDLAAECQRRISIVEEKLRASENNLQKERNARAALRARLQDEYKEDEVVAFEAWKEKGYGGLPYYPVPRPLQESRTNPSSAHE
jgi:hypothetical protein